MNDLITVIHADITTLEVDVIVNAANTSLLGGGGVDGAIHHKAGSKLQEACRLLGGCNVGEAKITGGYNLPAKYIIHTVGPIWKDGQHNEPELLANCYKNSLVLAEKNNLQSIAFPCISTGAYNFPNKMAADIAVQTSLAYLSEHQSNLRINFCCFLETDFEIYRALLDRD